MIMMLSAIFAMFNGVFSHRLIGMPNPFSTTSSDTECGVCEYVVTYAELLLQNNQTTTDIEYFLEKSCDLLPVSLATACDKIIDNYVPSIISLLEQKYPPSVICQDIHLCSNWKIQRYSISNSTERCNTCELFLSYAENTIGSMLQGNSWDKMAIELENACSKLPYREASICEMMVGMIPSVILNEMAQYPPNRLCTMAKVC